MVENLVQNQVGHAEYGLFAALLNLALITSVLADLGLAQHTTKRIASAPEYLAEYFPTVLPLKVALSGLFLGGTLLVGWLLGYRGHTLVLLGLATGIVLLTQFTAFLRGALQGYQRFNIDAVLSVLDKATAILLLLGGLSLGVALTLDGYVIVRAGATLLTFVTLYALLTRLYGRVPYRPRWSQARTVLRESLPLAAIALVYGLNERVDGLMLERLVSAREAGYYAGAYRWVDAVMMYLWTVLPLFFAKFAHATARRDEQQTLLWFGQRIVTVPLLLVCAFVLFRGEVLFWQFTRSTPAELVRMTWCLKLLFLNVLVHAFFAIYSTLLTSTGQEQPVSWLVAGSTLLNISLNLLLLPRYGALAAAADTLLCALFVSGGYLWLVTRRTGVAVPWATLARLLLAFGLLCAAWWGLRWWLNTWWLEAGLASGLFVGILFLTGNVRVAELRQLLQRK
ncbi:oligosaccharide flippase family protein [Hymenobacter aerilatus]|uniref:Oligosaccharide flippase family protein n=1 Tax=Hymenobacter aerilatus TaxID=2932251 RepID=A0A8T9T1A5_9BACT|nr:oligosaccharide flippase family protein [Hymenobacter aerilatus]